MNKMKKVILLSILAIAAGCSQNNSPSTSSITTQKKVPFLSSGWLASNYAATFETHKVVVTDVDTQSGTTEDAIVYLWDSTAIGPVNGGTVTMNGTTISPVDMTADSGGYYYDLDMAAGQTVPISFSGGSLIFAVSGSSNFAALRDTIAFPNEDITVTAPVVGVTLSKSAGFTVTWNHLSSSPQTILIEVAGDTTAGDVQFVEPDNGSFTVPSASLSSFATGIVSVRVSRVDYKLAVDYIGREYAMAAYTTSEIKHVLNP